jgi:hypothetical protein
VQGGEEDLPQGLQREGVLARLTGVRGSAVTGTMICVAASRSIAGRPGSAAAHPPAARVSPAWTARR